MIYTCLRTCKVCINDRMYGFHQLGRNILTTSTLHSRLLLEQWVRLIPGLYVSGPAGIWGLASFSTFALGLRIQTRTFVVSWLLAQGCGTVFQLILSKQITPMNSLHGCWDFFVWPFWSRHIVTIWLSCAPSNFITVCLLTYLLVSSIQLCLAWLPQSLSIHSFIHSFIHFWYAPVPLSWVHSARWRHHSPEWAILSHISIALFRERFIDSRSCWVVFFVQLFLKPSVHLSFFTSLFPSAPWSPSSFMALQCPL